MALNIVPNTTYVNTDYNVQITDEVLIATTREAAFTLYLPDIETMSKGYGFTLKDGSGQSRAFPVTITCINGSQEIEGQASYVQNVDWGTLQVFVDNGRYVVLNSNVPTVLPIENGGTDGQTAAEAVDNLGLDIKAPVRVSTKENIDLSDLSAMTNVTNSVTLEDGDDVNVWKQDDPIENGIYHVNVAGSGSDGVWERRSDFNDASEIRAGVRFRSLEGGSYAGIYFEVLSNNPVVGTDPISIHTLNDTDAVYDPYGNKIFGYGYNANAVAYWKVENAAEGASPYLRAYSDTVTHQSGILAGKGNGKIFQLPVMETTETVTIDTASDVTYVGPAILGGFFIRDPNGSDRTDTIPDASTILSYIPQYFINLSFKLKIYNSSAAGETITLTGGTGINILGDGVIAAGKTREFYFLITDTALNGGSDTIQVYDLYPAEGAAITLGSGLVDTLGVTSVDVAGDMTFSGNQLTISKVDPSKIQLYVSNQTGGTVNPGTAVGITMNTDGTQGIVLANKTTGVEATYVVGSLPILDSTFGYVVKAITMGSQDTSGAADVGSKLYLDTNGAYVFDTAPTGSGDLVQVLGYVAAKDPTSGVLIFNPQPPTKVGTSFIQDGAITVGKTSINAGFTGNALGGHTHTLTYASELIGSVTEKKLYPDTVVGAAPVATATLLQATTGATANVVSYSGSGSVFFVVDTITGTFSNTDLVTGTNPDTTTFTFTPVETLIDCFSLTGSPAAFSCVATGSGPLVLIVNGIVMTTGHVRYNRDYNQIESLDSDGYTMMGVEYASATSGSTGAGTPSGTINLT